MEDWSSSSRLVRGIKKGPAEDNVVSPFEDLESDLGEQDETPCCCCCGGTWAIWV